MRDKVPEMTNKVLCSECLAFSAVPNSPTRGACRRYSPARGYGFFPAVERTDWCLDALPIAPRAVEPIGASSDYAEPKGQGEWR